MVTGSARLTSVPDPTPDLESARAAFLGFLASFDKDSSLLAFHDFDNEGYLPDRVHFSARSAPGTSVLDFLRNIELTEGEDTYGHGHDQASGGNLSFSRWNVLLGVLGFPARTFAPDSATITRT